MLKEGISGAHGAYLSRIFHFRIMREFLHAQEWQKIKEVRGQ